MDAEVSSSTQRTHERIWLVAIGLAVALGAGVRVWAALQWRMNFDSDEAIFALMARHILQGRFTPAMYGTQYLGSFESILSAAVMGISEEGVFAFRSSTLILFFAFFVLQAFYVGRHWGRRVAFLATAFLALAGFHILEWTYQPIGAYGVMMAVGSAILLVWDRLPGSGGRRAGTLISLGLLVGIGLWSNQMTIVFVLAAFFPVLLRSEEWADLRKRLTSFSEKRFQFETHWVFPVTSLIVGFLIVSGFFVAGCSPPWRFAKLQQVAKIGLAMGLLAGSVGLLACSRRKRERVSDTLLLGMGAAIGYAPLWVSWLMSPYHPASVIHRSCPTGAVSRSLLLVKEILPALWGIPTLQTLLSLTWWERAAWMAVPALIVGSMVYFVITRRGAFRDGWCWSPPQANTRADMTLILLLTVPLALNVLGSNTVDIYSVRHLLIAWLASAVVFAVAIEAMWVRGRLVALVLTMFWLGLVGGSALSTANGHWRVKFTTYSQTDVERLTNELDARGIDAGYADYWGAYTLDFLTRERIIIAPYDGVDRYLPYTQYVDGHDRFFLVFPSTRSPRAGASIDQVAAFLRLPNDVSGEGPARDSIVGKVMESRVEETFAVGPWSVWVLAAPGTTIRKKDLSAPWSIIRDHSGRMGLESATIVARQATRVKWILRVPEDPSLLAGPVTPWAWAIS
jgi:hypothetical protein